VARHALTTYQQGVDGMLTLNLSHRLRTTRWLLLALLASLHGVLWLGVESDWARPLMLAHLGLFLIWQPIWRDEAQVSKRALVFITLSAVLVVFALNWWLIAFWLSGLFGLVGGRVLAYRTRWVRIFSLSKMVYLLALLLLWVMPNLFSDPASIEIGRLLMSYVLPAALPLVLFMPAHEGLTEKNQTIDFFYSLLLFMLLALVILGSLAFMTLAHVNYLEALLRTLFLIGLILLALGGLWNPRFGFNGLQVVFSRYLLNIGTPFESWLMQLANAAQVEPTAASYLDTATSLLADLPWLSGLSWQTLNDTGQRGEFSPHAVVMYEGELRLTVYTKVNLSPTVLLHIRLLSQLIGYFYQAKQREQSLRDISRMQAIYETGSRLTHDLKNMLQSLLTLSSIAQSDEPRAQQLLRQQLPILSERIQQTLVKLQQPEIGNSDTTLLPLNAWWDNLRQRYQHLNIEWHGELNAQPIPVTMFDSVLDNLLANALRKKEFEPQLKVVVAANLERGISISVTDSGSAIPNEHVANLFSGVVNSAQGLGIGLYQAAKWAEQLGYRLQLKHNENGVVSFELRG
jgi:signal transduction histidine kinase